MNLQNEKDIKIAFFDIDGTLIDMNRKNISDQMLDCLIRLKENDIILLHDCYSSSVEAALRIIDILQERGYEFVTVDRLLMD